MKKKLFSCAAVLLLLCVVLSAGILCRKKTIRAISFLEVAGPCPIAENVEYHLSPETMETIFGHKRKIYTFVSYRKIGYKRDLRESVNFTLEELIPIAENDLTELGLMPDNFYQGGQSGYRMEKPNQSFLVLGRVFIGK